MTSSSKPLPHNNGASDGAMPAHVAIIMDGNGRWAKARHRPRVMGHQQGVKAVRRTVEAAAEMGVRCLTLYSFSTENWSRPKSEIAALFDLLRRYVNEDLETLHARNVRLRIIGSREGLGQDMIDLINHVERRTQGNDGFFLNVAFNYGGRDEIMRAAVRLAKDIAKGEVRADAVTAQGFETYLDTAELPPVELVIRTSGEHRISNFLLWQAAYAEFVFTDVLWPDFGEADLQAALTEFMGRDRRFGGLDKAKNAEVA